MLFLEIPAVPLRYLRFGTLPALAYGLTAASRCAPGLRAGRGASRPRQGSAATVRAVPGGEAGRRQVSKRSKSLFLKCLAGG